MSHLETPGRKRDGEVLTKNEVEGLSYTGSNKKKGKKNKKDSKIDTFESPVFSVRYKDQSVELSEDRLEAAGNKGWATVLASHGTSKGSWYFEVKILEPVSINHFSGYSKYFKLTQRPNVRIGWSCRYSRYDIPIGSTAHSYSLCTRSLSVFNKGIKNARETQIHSDKNNECGVNKSDIKPGDILGCLINLSGTPYSLDNPKNSPHLHPYLELGMLCDPEKPPEEVIDLESYIKFYLNGKYIGSSYKGLASGFYHPAVSFYMGSRVRINTGPDFWYPIEEQHNAALYLDRPEIR
ncbi:hypothetical protein FG386_000382 [Cryptosporidium ryanae]|uniref:uncharacterized protein n=1 Tax=Cryptosporidium ryanae TaxID=515981 RepID=UPI00351A9B36|nr:hypothetical protein FG386_000382 [Cryptosporidium ryanae]